MNANVSKRQVLGRATALMLVTTAAGWTAWLARPALIASTQPDRDVAMAAGWLLEAVAAYVVMCVLACLMSEMLGSASGIGRMMARLAPSVIQRAVVVLLTSGVTSSLAIAAADAGPAHGHPHQTARTASTSPFDWPGLAPAPSRRPSAITRQQTEHPATTTNTRPAAATAVVVIPGDSLWRIAAERLGAQRTDARIATAWPKWYAANRATIGAHPNLIHPGQRLRPPAPSRSSRAPRSTPAVGRSR